MKIYRYETTKNRISIGPCTVKPLYNLNSTRAGSVVDTNTAAGADIANLVLDRDYDASADGTPRSGEMFGMKTPLIAELTIRPLV